MIPRFKRPVEAANPHLKKEEFLAEHNKLSPINMQATMSLLSRFKEEKALLFHGDDWPIDKMRRPFIMWLTSVALNNH